MADINLDDGLEWFLKRIEQAEKMILNLVEQLDDWFEKPTAEKMINGLTVIE